MDINNMKLKRKLAVLLLMLSVFFSIFLGTYHHFCNHFSNRCLTCHQIYCLQGLLTKANADENINPLSISTYLISTRECSPDTIQISIPLKERAPPFQEDFIMVWKLLDLEA
jgi:hypothetical protein